MSTPSTWQTIRTLLTPQRIVMLGVAGVLFLAVLCLLALAGLAAGAPGVL